MRAKKVNEMKAQIKRCVSLAKELGYEFGEYHPRISKAIYNSCMQRYGFHAHSSGLSKFLKSHPELY